MSIVQSYSVNRLLLLLTIIAVHPSVYAKEHSVFFPPGNIEAVQRNALQDKNVAQAKETIVTLAEPWVKMTDNELWSMMFGPTITRSWHVLSDGVCPACKVSVTTPYSWRIDVINHPWKVLCPHCKGVFPTNDFYTFYVTGLDDSGVFDPELADRSLLYNEDHPDPQDPLYRFGVDDGEGYVVGDTRWRFIGHYLIAGQWKARVLVAIDCLSKAYIVTGSPEYAHKAGILLDRVADLYPSFDFGTQGKVYEIPPKYGTGYVSIWHDACIETRFLAEAYDRVFDALKEDRDLVEFLSDKARKHHLANPKQSWSDVQWNIEQRVLRDALNSPAKIYCNYPQKPMTEILIRTVLGWPEDKQVITESIDELVAKSTSVDGVTGEKGLTTYTPHATRNLAEFLANYTAIDPSFLPDLMSRHPDLRHTFRFFMDTWCQQTYYPQSGDSGYFGVRNTEYLGVNFQRLPSSDSGYSPMSSMRSMYSFFWDLYQATGDPGYAQVMYHAIGEQLDDLPQDLFAGSPEQIRSGIEDVIRRYGATLKVGSINKQGWKLAILRSGNIDQARSLWLDYDSAVPNGYHSHADGMNLGLFAYGLNLMPDFGYPPVQYGGWDSPQARWYSATAAHNTVVVNDNDQPGGVGTTALWAIGDTIRAIRVEGADMVPPATRFGRIAALIDAPEDQFYVIDAIAVDGGDKHTRYQHAYFGTIETSGLTLQHAPAVDPDVWRPMRHARSDHDPDPAWSVVWRFEDKYGILPPGDSVHMSYIDLTEQASVTLCEQWICPNKEMAEEAWIPCVITSRERSENVALFSDFVAVIDPYDGSPTVSGARRLRILDDPASRRRAHDLAIEIRLFDGTVDLLVIQDVGAHPDHLTLEAGSPVDLRVDADSTFHVSAEVCFIRRGPGGDIERVALCNGRGLVYEDLSIDLNYMVPIVEILIIDGEAQIVSGDIKSIDEVKMRGKPLSLRASGHSPSSDSY